MALSVASAGAEPEAVSQGSIATHTQVDVSEGPSPGYSQVVDNATEGRFEAPGWEARSGGEHFAGDYAYAGPSGAAPARFKVDVPESGRYTVYARWPAAKGNAAAARFGVSTASGTEWTEVDQRKDGGTTDCYGDLREDSNIQITCENENYDNIWTDNEFKTWRQVCKFLENNYNPHIEELTAV